MDATPKPPFDDIPLEPLLVRNVEPPSPRVPTWFLVAIASIGITSTMATVALPFVVLLALDAPDVVVSEAVAARTSVPVVEIPGPTPLPDGADLVLLTSAGGRTFAILQAIDHPKPWSKEAQAARAKRDEPHYAADVDLLGELEYPDGALRRLGASDLPASVSSWLGRSLLVNNDCDATVDHIVELSLLTGTPDYVDGTVQGADPRTMMLNYAFDYGIHYYATELGTCKLGHWARVSTLPLAYPAVDAGKVPAKLARAAKKDLVGSDAGRAAQARWRDNGNAGSWLASEDGLEMRYVTHPKTGEHWLVAHAVVDYSCGGSEINIIAIYRQEGDELVRHHAGDAESLFSISDLVDIDGNGTFEILGNAYLSGPALATDRGVITRQVETPFYGCPC